MNRIQDNYEKSFASLDEAMEEFSAFKDNAETWTEKTGSLVLTTIDETHREQMDEEAYSDTKTGSALVLNTSGHGPIPMRECAVPHLLERAGYSCPLASKERGMLTEEFTRSVTRALCIMGGESTIYRSFEKITCIGSGKYAPMEPHDLAGILVDSLSEKDSVEFVGGSISHGHASLQLALSSGVTASYTRVVEEYECDERDIIPLVSLRTSSTKDSGVHIGASLMDSRSGTIIPVGNLATIIHKGVPAKRLGAFRSACDDLYARCSNVTAALERLLTIDLDYPLSVLNGVAKEIGFQSKKLGPYYTQAYNRYAAMWGTAPANAHELYWALAETLNVMRETGVSEREILDAEEYLLKALSKNISWEKYDRKPAAAIA